MTNTQLALCEVCKQEFLLDLNRPNRYIIKKNGKQVGICPECRKIFVGES